jgi:hypothetical protein
MSARIAPFATTGVPAPLIQLSERPMLLTQKKPKSKKKLELVVQSSIPPRRSSQAPRRTSTLKPPKK